jgi:hypothetical protein
VRPSVKVRWAVTLTAPIVSTVAFAPGAWAATTTPAAAGADAAPEAATTAAASCDESDGYAVYTAASDSDGSYPHAELWYSPNCRTAWAKADSGDPVNGWAVGVNFHRNDSNNTVVSCGIPEGKKTCATSHLSDSGFTSFAEGYYETNSGYKYFSTPSY